MKHSSRLNISVKKRFDKTLAWLDENSYDISYLLSHGVSCSDGLRSDVFATVRTQDVVSLSQKATTHQGHSALCAVEAVVVPLTLLEGDILAATQTCTVGFRIDLHSY